MLIPAEIRKSCCGSPWQNDASDVVGARQLENSRVTLWPRQDDAFHEVGARQRQRAGGLPLQGLDQESVYSFAINVLIPNRQYCKLLLYGGRRMVVGAH